MGSRHHILGLCPCFSTSERPPILLTYESKRRGFTSVSGVNCSCFSIRTVLGGAPDAEKRRAVPPFILFMYYETFYNESVYRLPALDGEFGGKE